MRRFDPTATRSSFGTWRGSDHPTLRTANPVSSLPDFGDAAGTYCASPAGLWVAVSAWRGHAMVRVR